MATVAVPAHVLAVLAKEQASVAALIWLGALDRYGLFDKPLKKASRSDVVERADLLRRGAELAADWPVAFHRLLQRLRMPADTTGAVQLLRNAFPGFEGLLRRLRDPAWKDRVNACVQGFLHASATSSSPLVSRSPRLRQDGSTQTAAAKTLGVRIERVPVLLAEAGVQAPQRVTAMGRVRRIVSESALVAVRERLDDRISLKSAARLLGLSTDRLLNLKDGGLLTDRSGAWSRGAVDEFGARVKKQSRSNVPKLPSAPLVLAQTLRRWVPVERTVPCFQAILAGEVILYQSHPEDLISELYVDEASFARWHAESNTPEIGCLTLPDVATQLGLKQEVVYHLAAKGLLRSKEGRVGSRVTRLVRHDDLGLFKRSYVPLVFLARGAGIAPRLALEWALSLQMKVVTGPAIDDGRQYIVLKDVQQATGQGLSSIVSA